MDQQVRGTPVDHTVTDIRYDEDYAKFYEAYGQACKLPPPIEGRTLYQDIPGLLQRSRLGQQMLAGAGAANQQMLLRANGEAAGKAAAEERRHELLC